VDKWYNGYKESVLQKREESRCFFDDFYACGYGVVFSKEKVQMYF